MNIAPIAIVMPVPFHAPNAEDRHVSPCASCPSGSSGKRCARRHVARDERHDADDQKRRQRRNAEDALRLRCLRRAAVLQPERDEQERGREQERGVDAQRETRLDERQVRDRETATC